MPSSSVTWIKCPPTELHVGQTARIVEQHLDGPTVKAEVTIEGEITRMDDYYAWFGPVATSIKERANSKIEYYRKPRRLPLHAGSIIKVFDTSLMCDRAAVRRFRCDLKDPNELAWFWADCDLSKVVPDHLLETAEILFDASR